MAIMTKTHHQQMIYDDLNDVATYKELDKDIEKDIKIFSVTNK